MSERLVFEAIVFVLRTECQWKSLPKERLGSASSVHKFLTVDYGDDLLAARLDTFFYGVTISSIASLIGLKQICFIVERI